MVPEDFRTPDQPASASDSDGVRKLLRVELIGRRPVGRPRKPPLTEEEAIWVCRILGEGLGAPRTGWRWAAKTISAARGADADPDAGVSVWWLRRQLEQRGFCRACWQRGMRGRDGNFEPGTCPKHFRGVYAQEVAA